MRPGQRETLCMLRRFSIVTFVGPTGLGKSTIAIALACAAAARGRFTVYVVPLLALQRSLQKKFADDGFDVVCGTERGEVERIRRRSTLTSVASSGAGSTTKTVWIVTSDAFGSVVVAPMPSAAVHSQQLGAIILDEGACVVESLSYRPAMWSVGRTLRAIVNAPFDAARATGGSMPPTQLLVENT